MNKVFNTFEEFVAELKHRKIPTSTKVSHNMKAISVLKHDMDTLTQKAKADPEKAKLFKVQKDLDAEKIDVLSQKNKVLKTKDSLK